MFSAWVIGYVYGEWYKSLCNNYLQVTLPDDNLHRWRHSITSITLCPELVEVVVFGGTTEDHVDRKPESSLTRIAETTIITFSESLHCTSLSLSAIIVKKRLVCKQL